MCTNSFYGNSIPLRIMLESAAVLILNFSPPLGKSCARGFWDDIVKDLLHLLHIYVKKNLVQAENWRQVFLLATSQHFSLGARTSY